jgi:hypothetical protein
MATNEAALEHLEVHHEEKMVEANEAGRLVRVLKDFIRLSDDWTTAAKTRQITEVRAAHTCSDSDCSAETWDGSS